MGLKDFDKIKLNCLTLVLIDYAVECKQSN